MTYRQRMSLFIFIDSIIIIAAIFISRLLVNSDSPIVYLPIVLSATIIMLSHHFFSFLWKLYKKA